MIACREKQNPNEPLVYKGGTGNLVFDTNGISFSVSEVMNQFSKAYNNADSNGLNKLLSNNFLMITGITEHSFFTKQEFLQFIKDSKDTSLIDLKSPFNYLPGPRKITVAYTGLAAAAQDSVSFLHITKQKMVMNIEHYGAVYLNAFLQKEGSDWKIQFISLYPVVKDEK